MILSGIYENTIDTKNRVVVPQELRSQVVNEAGEVWLTYSPDSCIRIYSVEAYEKLLMSIHQAQVEKQDTRVLQHIFIKAARKAVLDSGGRVFLPQEMRSWAKIPDTAEGKIETAVVGNDDHLEIWLKSEFDATFAMFTPEMGFAALQSIGFS
ncbi:MAG: hypothetical protein IJS71_06935 [Clostridia bacterium]|nr:hypothetical protein [Clostridia bacterium]